MKDTESSFTAEGAAAMRAAGCHERDPAVRNPDRLAHRLVSSRLRRLVANPLLRRAALAYFGYRLPGMYEAHLARSHHFDARVRAALEAGARQYVVLGAGLDTRAYRLRAQLEGVRVFEVDHPATSAHKRRRLAAADLPTDHVRYVEVDFTRESAPQRLAEHGLDPTLPTVVTWEGVTMYLDAEAVGQVLHFVSTLPAGSSIVFDYVYPSFHEAPHRYRHAQRHLDYVKKVDEPYTFGLEFDQVEAFAAQHGLRLRDNVDAEAMERRYLKGRRGVTPWYAIAQAEPSPA